MTRWWCSSCRECVDSSDGKCPSCRGAVTHAEPRPSVVQSALANPLLKECSRCHLVALHAKRSDSDRPRPMCKKCHKAYLRTYRAQSWQREKARNTWRGMIRRCHDPRTKRYWGRLPSWRDYGAKGVKVCDRWQGPDGFENFVRDLGLPPTPIHTLDRANPSKGYTPSNTRWVDPTTQRANRKNSRWLLAQNPTTGIREWHTMSDWARIAGVHRSTVAKRLRNGWSADRAVSAKAAPVPF